eukprot:3242903-Amphidinium_carterae.1
MEVVMTDVALCLRHKAVGKKEPQLFTPNLPPKDLSPAIDSLPWCNSCRFVSAFQSVSQPALADLALNARSISIGLHFRVYAEKLNDKPTSRARGCGIYELFEEAAWNRANIGELQSMHLVIGLVHTFSR